MSKMPPISHKKRRLEDAAKGKTSRPQKRIRKQKNYHSSSDEDSDASVSDTGFAPVTLQDSDEEAQQKPKIDTGPPQKRKEKSDKAPDKAPVESSDSNASSSDEDDDPSDADLNDATTSKRPKTKRNDPTSFSTSISKILSTKLPTSTRSDPLLSRSAAAHATTTSLAHNKLEAKAKALLRAQRKAALDSGRITDVLGLESGTTGEVAEEEKRLRKIAQRGVVKLFNAVRAAQVRSEEALKEEREKGVVGRKEREEKAKEMSKEGFLDLIGGKKERRRDRGSVEA